MSRIPILLNQRRNNMEWILANWKTVLEIFIQVVGIASIIVKLTPTLKDDNIWLPIVKFLGKYIALNKTVKADERPIV
jgi:hypothetical protein